MKGQFGEKKKISYKKSQHLNLKGEKIKYVAHLETKIKFTGEKTHYRIWSRNAAVLFHGSCRPSVLCTFQCLRFCFCGFGLGFLFWCGFYLRGVVKFGWLFFLTPRSLFCHPRYRLPFLGVVPITCDCTNSVLLVSTETLFRQKKTVVGLLSFEITELCFNLFFNRTMKILYAKTLMRKIAQKTSFL